MYEEIIEGLKNEEKLNVELPKFEIEFKVELSDILQKLGIEKAFSNDAELKGICDKSPIHINNVIQKNTIDVITINPPYKEKGSGIINENNSKLISRHETTADLKDFIEISSKLLKSKGELYIVHKVERLVDLICLMRENKLEPKKIRFIYSGEGKEANLVLLCGIKGARKFLKIEKPLYIYEGNGDYSKEIKAIYNKE